MDWDYAPSALDAELFEEGGCDDGMAGGVGVWVEECSTDNGDENDGETTTKDLRAVADHRTSRHGPEVGNYLSDSDGVGAEVVLVLQHGGVEILRSVRLENY